MAAVVVATAGAVTSGASIVSSTKAATATAASSSRSTSGRRATGIRRLSLHGGLKAQNEVMAMGLSLSTEQQFANVRTRCSAVSVASSKKGGALASTCDVASEVFTVIPIMSILVLIGIAVGFVLLRIEAIVEDSD